MVSFETMIADVLTEPTPKPLEFVTISNPRDLQSRSNQRRIRRHAGQSVAHRKPKKDKSLIHTVDFIPLEGTKETATDNCDPQLHQGSSPLKDDLSEQLNLYDSPLNMNIWTNPLIWLPAPVDERSGLLIEFLVNYKRKSKHIFAPLCIRLAVRDLSSFYLVLAAASSLYSQQVGRIEDENVETTTYYAAALQSVNSRLQDPVENTSEELIGSLVALICQDVHRGEFSRWEMHMQGVKQIIGLRGGLTTLSSINMLRHQLFLNDINGGLALDARPHFQMAPYITELDAEDETAPPSLGSILLTLRTSSDNSSDIIDALISVARLSKYINTHAFRSGFFEDDDIRTDKFFPVADRVIRLPRLLQTSDEAYNAQEMTREATRLALFLYMALLKERFSIGPECVTATKDRLVKLLTYYPADRSTIPSLWLWIYATLAVAASNKERQWVFAKITALMQSMNIQSWLDAVSTIRGVTWVDEISVGGLAVLGLEIQRHQYIKV